MRLRLIVGVALIVGNLHPQAQQLGLEYNTEWQTNFRGDYNWVNLMRLSASVQVSAPLTVEAATISVAKTATEPIINDLQVFSNIEEENLPLAIAVLGAQYVNRRSTFFLGIRNVNEDYFTSPVTSLFVNSSCGIFPTLSANYDLANYPLASWCIHYKAEWENFILQSSLYQGVGHNRFAGHDNVFKFNPRSDGLLSITSAEYIHNGSNYSMGCALYYGVHNRDGLFGASESAQAEATPSTKKTLSAAPWVNVEQRLTNNWSLLLQGSVATANTYCRAYAGLGTSFMVRRIQFGLFADYARYSNCNEVAAELTCQVPLTPILSAQPTLELIRTGGSTAAVALTRLTLTL